MKTLFILLALSATALLATTVRAQSAGTAPPPVRTSDREEKRSDVSAIRQTIDDGRAAFDKRDQTAHNSYFVNSPDLYYQVSTPDHQIILAHGFENMKKMVGEYMQSHPTPAPVGSFKMTLRIRVNGNTAFVTSNSLDTITNEHSQDFIVLEKTGGNGSAPRWKISALTAQYYEAGKRVEVN